MYRVVTLSKKGEKPEFGIILHDNVVISGIDSMLDAFHVAEELNNPISETESEAQHERNLCNFADDGKPATDLPCPIMPFRWSFSWALAVCIALWIAFILICTR